MSRNVEHNVIYPSGPQPVDGGTSLRVAAAPGWSGEMIWPDWSLIKPQELVNRSMSLITNSVLNLGRRRKKAGAWRRPFKMKQGCDSEGGKLFTFLIKWIMNLLICSFIGESIRTLN